MQSQGMLRKLSQQSRTARQHSCSLIPSPEQAKARDQSLKVIHNRRHSLRRKSLEGVVRDNYRLFMNIHDQKSIYHNNFLDVRRRRKPVRAEAPKPMLQLKKATKWVEMLSCGTKEGKRRYQLHPVLRERCANLSQNSNYTTRQVPKCQ